MQTAWKVIPTLSRMCAHCCRGLNAAHGSAYAAGIQQELDEWKSLTDGSSEDAGFELRPGGIRVPCFAGCAPCERGSVDAWCAVGILRSRGSCPAPYPRA